MPSALKKIAQAGDQKISFSYEDVVPYKVNTNVQNKTVIETLQQILAGTPLLYKERGQFITVYLDPQSSVARAKRNQCFVCGRVLDGGRNPLPGATVRIKDTSRGVVTDENGEFHMLVKCDNSQYVLQASYIGMKTVEEKIQVSKGANIKVSPLIMQDDLSSIDEVVITGYQNISKARSTGAVTQLKMDDIMSPGLPSVDQMLSGNVPGLLVMQTSGEPTATPKIRIRGTSSILGNKAPLWVLDGIILTEDVTVDHSQLNGDDAAYLVGNAIAGVNPQDIESITVLKDASATALYGVQAANGVIVVTTKKGKIGKPQVRYSGSVSVSERIGYGDLNLMNAAERIDLSRQIIDNGYRYIQVPYDFGYEGAYLNYLNGGLTYSQFVSEVQNMAERNTDWYGLLFRNSFSHNHTLTVSGGTEQTTYYGSLGYSDTQSTGRSSDSKRYNFNSKINSWLKPEKLYLGVAIRAYTTKNEGYSTMAGVNPNSYAYNTSRTVPAYGSNGEPYMYETRYASEGTFGTAITGVPSTKRYSILNEIANTGMKSDLSSFTGSLDFHWKVIPDLTYELFGSYEKNTRKVTDWAKEGSTYVADIRGYMKGDVEKGSEYESLSPLPYGGIYSQNNTNVETAILRNTLRYNRTFAKHHTVGLMGVSEIRTIKTEGLSGDYAGWYPERGNTFNPVKTDAYLKSDLLASPVATGYTQNYVSWLGNFIYSYKDKLTVSGNIRMDGSNQFGSNPKYRFLPVWSVAGKYTLSNEKFMQNQDVINYLAFRASYGVQGNVDSSTSPDLVIRVGALNGTTQLEESFFEYLPNADLRWEKTTSYNFGLDFQLFNDWINGTVDVYKKKGVDMIMAAKVSQAVGASSVKVNYGKMNNSGVDLGLRLTPYRSKDWEANVILNYSYVKNKLIKANPDVTYSFSEMAAGNAMIEGEPLGLLFSYPFAGLDPETGYPLFYGKDGKTTSVTAEGKTVKNYTLYTDEVEMVQSGVTTPPHSGGFTLSGRYKDLRLSATFSYSWGAVGRLPQLYDSEQSNAFRPITNLTREYADRWYKPGDEAHTNIPKMYNYNEYSKLVLEKYDRDREEISGLTMYNNSTVRVAPTDILRLSSISLSYYLHLPCLKRVGISDMQLSLSGTNLCFWADKAWNGRDPESGTASVPTQPTYTFNVNINF
jgi:Outer membrane receptor proteins, mostly Fe transport